MEVNWPKGGTASFRSMVYLTLAISGGYGLYFLSNSVGWSIFAAAVIWISLPLISSHIKSVKFTNHISGYGESVKASDFARYEDRSVVGVVPFEGDWQVCSIYIEERGIVISCHRTNRLIAWEQIMSIRHLNFWGRPIVELSISSFELKNRLLIPWSENLNRYIPSNTTRYCS